MIEINTGDNADFKIFLGFQLLGDGFVRHGLALIHIDDAAVRFVSGRD